MMPEHHVGTEAKGNLDLKIDPQSKNFSFSSTHASRLVGVGHWLPCSGGWAARRCQHFLLGTYTHSLLSGTETLTRSVWIPVGRRYLEPGTMARGTKTKGKRLPAAGSRGLRPDPRRAPLQAGAGLLVSSLCEYPLLVFWGDSLGDHPAPSVWIRYPFLLHFEIQSLRNGHSFSLIFERYAHCAQNYVDVLTDDMIQFSSGFCWEMICQSNCSTLEDDFFPHLL